jgi:hypothetical protein
LKMDLTEGSETSANINQTPGSHPKVDKLNTEHGGSLKSRISILDHYANGIPYICDVRTHKNTLTVSVFLCVLKSYLCVIPLA